MKERGLLADVFALAKAIAEARKKTPLAAGGATSVRTVSVKEAVETRADKDRDDTGATRLRSGGVKAAAERQADSSRCAGPALKSAGYIVIWARPFLMQK
jgi:hypothetical protein